MFKMLIVKCPSDLLTNSSVRLPNSYVLKLLFSSQVQDITGKIQDAEYEHARLESENANLQSTLNAKVEISLGI